MQTQANHLAPLHGKWGVKIRARRRGFALIVTLTLMTLLAVLALGFLGLSNIALRTAGANAAQVEARSNARLALMLAIGDLQRMAGTDKAITATSEITSDNPSKKNLTGVWQSWAYEPGSGSAPSYATEKRNRFSGWLVSDRDPQAAKSVNYADSSFSGDTLELVSEGALGKSAPNTDRAVAGVVPIKKNGKSEGAFAWHVADESVKARIGTYRDPSQNGTLAKRRALLSGQRPDVSVISSRDGTDLDFLPKDDTQNSYKTSSEASGKLVNLSQADLFAQVPQISGKFRNSVTPYSLGLLTNARSGGLKKDLSSMFEAASLPTEYAGKRLYQSTQTLQASNQSDPNWSALASYYRLRGSIKNPDTTPTFSTAPTEDVDIKAAAPVAPTEVYPAPVIAKLDIVFTLVLRNTHSGWVDSVPQQSGQTPADPNRKYMMHLVYTPLITLHNPYNVNLSFETLRVIIRNPPVGFNFYVDDKAQNTKMVAMGEMFVSAAGEKSFALDIGNWKTTDLTNRQTSGPVEMKPGQTLVCSPYINPSQTFGGNASDTIFFDYQNNLTGVDKDGKLVPDASIPKAKPGFTGKGVGYDVDWLTPFDSDPAKTTDGGKGVLGMTLANRFRAEMGIMLPPKGLNTEFQVAAFITSNGTTKKYGGLSFKYMDDSTLKKNFTNLIKFPSSGTMTGADFHEPNSVPLVQQAKARAFGVLSAYARTSNGGVYETGKRTPTAGSLNALNDGRIAGKPFLFANAASTMEQFNMKNDVLGNAVREFNLQPLPGHVDDLFSIDATNRSNLLTANSTQKGLKSGSYLELPTGPMQAISDFRRSNALTTPFPPSYAQPVGNSWISPTLATSTVSQAGSGAGAVTLLDQSYLANMALYDGFFFSSVAADGTTGGDRVLKDFLNGARPLPNQGFQPWIPKGETVTSIADKLYSGSGPTADAYKRMASSLLVKGSFNVNSTNVEAWKAMLSSLRGSEISTFWAKTAVLDSARKATEVPILSMTLPVAGPTSQSYDAGKMDNLRTNQWNGYRELASADVDKLAKEIVKQVRLRGPFLSLSEFVNRQVGGDSELTRTGALQAAITESGLNNSLFPEADYVPIKETDISDPLYYNYKTPKILVGSPAEGAPGWITQGDLMKILEPAAAVRADTFVIRTCGQSVDEKGKVIARAYAEAVVQRVPEFVDPVDNATVNVYEASAGSKANKLFGRRLEIVSFRWLSNSEI